MARTQAAAGDDLGLGRLASSRLFTILTCLAALVVVLQAAWLGRFKPEGHDDQQSWV